MISRAVLLCALFSLALAGCSGSSGDETRDDGIPATDIDPGGFLNIYYVAPDGDDANPGSLEAPWATAQHAADTVVPGDLVYLRGGKYQQGFTTAASGTDAAWIGFASHPGERPLFDGKGVDRSNGIIIAHDYVILHGVATANWNSNAIWVEEAANFVIAEAVARDVPYGIGVGPGSHDFEIRDCRAHHFLGYGFDVTCAEGQECYNGVFNNCTSHTGSDPDQNVDGFALGHLHTRDFQLNDCTTYGVFDGFDISARNATLNNCLAYDCGNGGYKLWQTEITLNNCIGYDNGEVNVELDWNEEVGPTTTRIHGSTFVGSNSFNLAVENGASSLYLYNTIVADGENIGLAFLAGDASNYHGNHNLWHSRNPERLMVVFDSDQEYQTAEFSTWQTDTAQDQNSQALDSLAGLFVDPTAHDYHPAPGGPAVDTGDCQQTPAQDHEGTPRPQGTACDIGAFERK